MSNNCMSNDVIVLTNKGVKNINDINATDVLVTSKGIVKVISKNEPKNELLASEDNIN